MRSRTSALLFLFCLTQAVAADRQWYTLTIDGTRVGYAWRDANSEVVRVEVEQLLKRFTYEARSQVIRGPEGLPQRMVVASTIGPIHSGWQATLNPDARTLVLPDRLSEALRPLWGEGRQEMGFLYFEPAAGRPTALHAEALASRIQLSETVGRSTRKETLWIDTDGELVHREQKFFGATLVWDRCAHACDARVAQPFDLLSKLLVRSPYRIPLSALAGPIRYVIPQAPQIPVTGEQAVVMEGSTAILTVCTTCGVAEQLTESERTRYLQPNPWVQSDLPEIRDFANRHGRGRSQAEIMNNLVDAVRIHMTGPADYLGYGSAGEALKTRSGECTEYAVLLAALARAKGFPARIAYGLVYADHFSGKKDVFSPHAWVQVWTGSRWQSYDAGLGEFDATHLALGLGDGDPRDVATALGAPADLRIEKLGRVH